MNIAFVALTLISLIILTIVTPSSAFSTMISGVSNAILLTIKLAAIYAVWLSVLKMAQAIKADIALSKLLKPIVKKIFKKENDEAYNWICINLASNMLGMGGVATPAGIKAINAMTGDGDKATSNMILLLVINATSIQLVPATVIAIRATADSANAADIFFPTLISSAIATICGMIMCKVLSLKNKNAPIDRDTNNGVLNHKNCMIKPINCKIKKNRKIKAAQK